MATLKIVAKKLINGGVKYDANHAAKSLSAALKSKKTNCATFVSYALQEMGVLPKGKYIWLDKKSTETERLPSRKRLPLPTRRLSPQKPV